MFYSHPPWSSIHSFRARCTLAAPVEQLVACAREFDLVKEWNSHCVESIVLKDQGPMQVHRRRVVCGGGLRSLRCGGRIRRASVVVLRCGKRRCGKGSGSTAGCEAAVASGGVGSGGAAVWEAAVWQAAVWEAV
eukprot:162716-Chlamydomonas_euryale.AAC.1